MGVGEEYDEGKIEGVGRRRSISQGTSGLRFESISSPQRGETEGGHRRFLPEETNGG